MAPFHDSADVNFGGPHGATTPPPTSTAASWTGSSARPSGGPAAAPMTPAAAPASRTRPSKCIDVMGYHDAREIPNYWTYAQDFVLQDHMFESDASWSLPEHLYQVSEWSALLHESARPVLVHETRSRIPTPTTLPGTERALRSRRSTTPGPTDLPAAQARRQLGLLRVPGHRARLRERRRDDAARRSSRAPRPPASGTRCPTSPTVHQDGQLRQRPDADATSSPRPRTARCRPSRGSPPTARSQSTRRPWSAPARPTSPG